MNVKLTTYKGITKPFSTNGVLRCVSGALPTVKDQTIVQDADDILKTVQKVFKFTDREFVEIVETKNNLAAFILPLAAGKYLENANPILTGFKNRLFAASLNGNIETEINQIVSEVGKNINLKV